MKSIKKALKDLGDSIGKALGRLVESLIGLRQPMPELVPIPVRSGSHRYR